MSVDTPSSSGAETAVSIPARRSPLSGGLGVVVVIVLLGVAGATTYRAFTNPPPAKPVEQYVEMICAKTNKHFPHLLKENDAYPVLSPFSNERTGYPAERCFWTKDGNVKLEPTYVLLNEYIGKPGPTLCPDCGRLVEPHNPMPPPEKFQALQRATNAPATAPAKGAS